MSTNLSNPRRPLASFSESAGASAGREIPILEPVSTVGQGAQSDVLLDDDTVSTNHARIEYSDGAWRLTDLSSKNGTFINGERIAPNAPVTLSDGDVVAFGGLRLDFVSHGAGVAEEAARSYVPPVPAAARSNPAGFRLPLWVFLLILLILAIIAVLVLLTGGEPTIVDPVVQPVATLMIEGSFTRAA